MSDFYEDRKNRIVKKQLFNETAAEIAEAIQWVTKNQIRRIYDEIKRLKRKVEKTNSIEEFNKILPYILLERSKITYTIARAKKNLNPRKDEDKDKIRAYDKFKEFFDNYLTENKITCKEDYFVFCDYLEAILGFHYDKNKEK